MIKIPGKFRGLTFRNMFFLAMSARSTEVSSKLSAE